MAVRSRWNEIVVYRDWGVKILAFMPTVSLQPTPSDPLIRAFH